MKKYLLRLKGESYSKCRVGRLGASCPFSPGKNEGVSFFHRWSSNCIGAYTQLLRVLGKQFPAPCRLGGVGGHAVHLILVCAWPSRGATVFDCVNTRDWNLQQQQDDSPLCLLSSLSSHRPLVKDARRGDGRSSRSEWGLAEKLRPKGLSCCIDILSCPWLLLRSASATSLARKHWVAFMV